MSDYAYNWQGKVHCITINGYKFGNVSSIEPSIEHEYYYNVTALSGKKYQKIRYIKKNYTVTFFNLLDGQYVSLRKLIHNNTGKLLSCGFPDDSDGFKTGNYFVSIVSEQNKGYHNGNYFKNGLTVLFEAQLEEGLEE